MSMGSATATEADRDLQARQMSAAAAAATPTDDNHSPTAHVATLVSPSTAGRKHPRQADTEMDAAAPPRTADAADALPLSKAEHDAAVIKSEFGGVAPVPILPPMAPFVADQTRAAKTESMEVAASDCEAAVAAANAPEVKSAANITAACSPSTEFMPRASSANIAAMHTATVSPGSGHSAAGSHQRSSSSSMLPSFGSLTYRMHAHPGHGHGHSHDMHEYGHGMQISVHGDSGAMHSSYGAAMGQACAAPGGGSLSTSDYIGGGGLMDDGDDRSGGGSCHQVRTAQTGRLAAR